MTPDAPAGEESLTRAPRDWEWLWISAILIALLGFDLATYDYFPAVWVDDISFSEPAINFAKYGHYTTTVWQFQPPNTFPAVNCPGYLLALGPWLKLFGTTLRAARSFNYVLMALASFLIWCCARRFRLVASGALRVALVLVIHLSYGLSFSYRCSRPDMLGLVCLLLLVLAFGLRQSRWREIAVLGLSGALVWI